MANGTAISFNSNDMQTASVQTAVIDHHSGPTKNMVMYDISHTNFSAIPFINWPSKSITVTGRLVSDTISNLDALIDTFKSYFTVQGANLDIGYATSTRRYICTPESPQISRPKGLAYADFTVVFDCTQPFGQDTSTSTAWSASAVTTNTSSNTYTFTGTAPFQIPVTTITVNSVTDATGGYIAFGNNSTGQQVQVTRTWVAGDVLVIDPTNQTTPVTVNGTAVEFSGAFPVFPPGSGTMTYLDNLTARNFNISVVYYPLYI